MMPHFRLRSRSKSLVGVATRYINYAHPAEIVPAPLMRHWWLKKKNCLLYVVMDALFTSPPQAFNLVAL
jgi:hypothetical protein